MNSSLLAQCSFFFCIATTHYHGLQVLVRILLSFPVIVELQASRMTVVRDNGSLLNGIIVNSYSVNKYLPSILLIRIHTVLGQDLSLPKLCIEGLNLSLEIKCL